MPDATPTTRHCNAEYEPHRRERGQRLVMCDRPHGHFGDHCETDTGHTWPTEPDRTELARGRDEATARALELAAELDDLRQKLTRIVTGAGSHYEQLIAAARCASSGTDASADYWRWNGNAQALRETTNEIARVAGLEAPDWEQIKASIPADGIYRATTKETRRA